MTHEAARSFLAAVARGETPDVLLERLVAAVLEAPGVKLALEVRAGGPHQWRRAIELGGLFIRHSYAADECRAAE